MIPGSGGRTRGTGEHALGDSLEAYLRLEGHGEVSALARITAVWATVVGDDVASHVEPRKLRGSTLLLAVDRPLWATQVAFLSEAIVAGLTEELGEQLVDRLEATVRPI